MSYDDANPTRFILTGYTSTSTAMTSQSSSAWNYLTVCAVMAAQLSQSNCSYSFSSGFMDQVSYLVGLMNTAMSSNSNSSWYNFYDQVKTSLLPDFGEQQRLYHGTRKLLGSVSTKHRIG